MGHEIDMSNGRENVAYIGSKSDVWHHLGNEMPENAPEAAWLKAAGLGHRCELSPAFVLQNGIYVPVPDQFFVTRNDTGAVLSPSVTDHYNIFQPADVLGFFYQYVSVDARWKMDVAGSLRGGATVWATAIFNGEQTVAGSKHLMRALLSTTFDTSGKTILQGTETRTVCKNTLAVSHMDKRAQVKISHNLVFDAKRAARELAGIAASFDTYKAMAEAMATVHLAQDEVEAFFRTLVDIPRDAKRDATEKKDKVSTRKWNTLDAIRSGYDATIAEGTEAGTAWAALNGVTNFADHARGVRNTSAVSEVEARFTSANFGTGADLKGTAVNLLLPLIRDRVAIAA
jgi:phage/plasmid-like protein (TIGR03299 family)